MKLGCKPSKLDGKEEKYVVKQNITLPQSYTYQPYLSKVINQGSESTCVPCSISAYINWNMNVKTGINNIDNNVNIKEIYSIREDKGDGMTIKEALNYIMNHGVSTQNGIIKIRKYALIGGIMSLKHALIMNGPCVAALKTYNDSSQFWMKLYGDSFLGGHAIAIVGWNKEGFIIRNSWGQSWGKKGYTIMPFDQFGEFLEIWTLIN